MEIVPIKAVIANYFIENSDKTKVSLKELSYFKSEIDKKFLKDRILAQVQYYIYRVSKYITKGQKRFGNNVGIHSLQN